MPFAAAVPLIAAGLSGVAGMLNNRNRQNSTRTQATTPTLDPALGPLQQALINQAMARLNTNSLPVNFEAGGVNAINRSFDLASQNTTNTLTSRGLSRSPEMAGGVLERLNNARAGNVAQFRANVPVVQRQLELEDFGNIGQLLNMGRGSTSTGTSEDDADGGGGLAGATSNVATMLGFLMGQGLWGSPGQRLTPNTMRPAPTIPGWTIPRGTLVGG